MEIWKKIEGYENYSVSTYGRVRNDKTGRILKPRCVSHGYMQIRLHNSNGNKQFYVHRLVAMSFISNPDNLPYVNHKNEIRDDNRAINLEWCTQSYNINYGHCIENIINNMTGPKTPIKCCIDGIVYRSIKAASKHIGCNWTDLIILLKSGTHTYKGHSISYA